jgi:hypothetical protein
MASLMEELQSTAATTSSGGFTVRFASEPAFSCARQLMRWADELITPSARPTTEIRVSSVLLESPSVAAAII